MCACNLFCCRQSLECPFGFTAAHDSFRACTKKLWSLQASLSEHKVTESKPDNTVEDLRFHQPWTELQDFADTIDLSSADDIMHKHIPYGEPTRECTHKHVQSISVPKSLHASISAGCVRRAAIDSTVKACLCHAAESQLLGKPYTMLAEALLPCSPTGNLLITRIDVFAAILLIKAAHEWQKSHSGKLPSTSAQRSEFKNIIKSWQRQIDGIPIEVSLLQCIIIHHNCWGLCCIPGKCTAFVLVILSCSAFTTCMQPSNNLVMHCPQPTILLQILSHLDEGTSVHQKDMLHCR